MEQYLNKSGNSPITHYQINIAKIKVWFKEGKSYSYSYRKAGKMHVDNMKLLAVNGEGLATYITHNVRDLFD